MLGKQAGTGAMQVVAESTLSAAAASIDLQNLDQRYGSLLLVATLRGDTAAEQIETQIRFNGDATAVYNSEIMSAAAAAVTSAEVLAAAQARIANTVAATALANMFGGLVALIPDYTLTDRFKTVFSLGGSPVSNATTKTIVHSTFAVWRSTAAINRITLLPNAGNYIIGSHVRVYGLAL